VAGMQHGPRTLLKYGLKHVAPGKDPRSRDIHGIYTGYLRTFPGMFEGGGTGIWPVIAGACRGEPVTRGAAATDICNPGAKPGGVARYPAKYDRSRKGMPREPRTLARGTGPRDGDRVRPRWCPRAGPAISRGFLAGRLRR